MAFIYYLFFAFLLVFLFIAVMQWEIKSIERFDWFEFWFDFAKLKIISWTIFNFAHMKHIVMKSECWNILYFILFFLFYKQIVAERIGRQARMLFNSLVICAAFWLIFAIMGVQMFAGKFYHVSSTNIYDSFRMSPFRIECDALHLHTNPHHWTPVFDGRISCRPARAIYIISDNPIRLIDTHTNREWTLSRKEQPSIVPTKTKQSSSKKMK